MGKAARSEGARKSGIRKRDALHGCASGRTEAPACPATADKCPELAECRLQRRDGEPPCVVIVGGHDRMVRTYHDVCRKCGFRSKVYTQPAGNLEELIGTPDLIVLITNPVSHKMAGAARKRASKGGLPLEFSYTGGSKSIEAILDAYSA